MGYCITVKHINFRIKNENKQSALNALRSLIGKETCGVHSLFGETKYTHFSWVDTDEFKTAGILEDALRAWRWNPKNNPKNGDIIYLEFEGEKYGDEKILFTTLAPYIESNSEIVFHGEDGNVWKFVFKNGCMEEKEGKIVWD